MSATLGTFLQQLQPDWKIAVFERLGEVAQESSNAWNNAGTGHAALCELNYMPAAPDGSVDPTKAVAINEQFQQSRQFWSTLVTEGKLTTKLARKAVDGVLAGEGDVDEVVEKRGLEVVRDDGAIEKAVDDALAANPDIVEKYRAGNKKVTGAIVGAVMKATQGKADPGQVNKLIAEKLN